MIMVYIYIYTTNNNVMYAKNQLDWLTASYLMQQGVIFNVHLVEFMVNLVITILYRT